MVCTDPGSVVILGGIGFALGGGITIAALLTLERGMPGAFSILTMISNDPGQFMQIFGAKKETKKDVEGRGQG